MKPASILNRAKSSRLHPIPPHRDPQRPPIHKKNTSASDASPKPSPQPSSKPISPPPPNQASTSSTPPPSSYSEVKAIPKGSSSLLRPPSNSPVQLSTNSTPLFSTKSDFKEPDLIPGKQDKKGKRGEEARAEPSYTPTWLISSATTAWSRRYTAPSQSWNLPKGPPPNKVPRIPPRLHKETLRDCNEKLSRILHAPRPRTSNARIDALNNITSDRLSSALSIATDLHSLALTPNSTTYSLLIQICLATQTDRVGFLSQIEAGKRRREKLGDGHDELSVSLSEELAMEKERTQSWLEARRELLVQLRGSEYADGIKETTGVWFGSVEWEIGWALYSESVALNIKVDRQGLDALIQLSHIHPTLSSRITTLLSQPKYHPTLQTVTLALAPYLQSKTMYVEPRLRDLTSNLDVVLSRYAEYRSRGLVPKREVVEQIAARLVAVGWTKAAVEMAADFIGMGELNELSEDAWLGLIRGICRKKHAASLASIWDVAVKTGRVIPDVGLLQEIINLAGHAGLPEFAIEAFQLLKETQAEPPEEHQMAPIVDAWMKTGDLEAAFHSLSLMRFEGAPPSPNTAKPILDGILGGLSLGLEKDRLEITTRVDQAWFTLESCLENRGVVDVAAGNVVMQACLAVLDFSRAAETFNEFETLGITPDLESYHLLLEACMLRPDTTYPLYEKAIDLLSSSSVEFTPRTYERMVRFLCTQPHHIFSPGAFDQLELAKDAGGPTHKMYEAIIQRCALEGDGRARKLVEEMRMFGFTPGIAVSKSLQRAGMGGLVGLRDWDREPVQEEEVGRSGQIGPHL